MVRPIHTKTFTRNFTLATMQIWSRAETTDKKIWTENRQPFLPYIIVEGEGVLVSCYYDFRGVAWLKNLLTRCSNEDSAFIPYLQREITRHFDAVRQIFIKKSVLKPGELQKFLSDLEKAWVWFEAGWWLWEMTPEDKQKIQTTIPKEFYSLRENTHDVVPKSEAVIRASLQGMFRGLGSLCHFLTLEEIQNGVAPSREVLENRNNGFFFVDNTLYVDVSKKYIEDMYKIGLENTEISSDIKELSGEVAFRGKTRGLVKVVHIMGETGKVHSGDILVSSMTMPDLLPAMKMASAFVTDEGGVMCHAAIIARELKKPCIIGTKIATKVLKDGDLVEVDANKGVIKILNRAKRQ